MAPRSHQLEGPRFEPNRPAKVHFGDQSLPARCLDLYEGGARLRCATSEWLPLILEVEDAMGRRYRASLLWQGEDEIGVRWLKDGQSVPSAPSFGRRGRT
ncbi:MAG: hypothetical protein AB7E81_24210 [Hyphomicrobiaceae bacterium]